MGLVKKELARISLPDREAHNSRMFVDLCENIHIHYREFRQVFALDEYFEYADILARSTDDVRSYLAQNPDYEEGRFPTTIMVAGGHERQRKLLRNSPAPNRSTYFANDFVVELQDESVVDEIHVHWRDFRFAVPREHLKAIADAFSEARRSLEQFEADNEYLRSPHRDRTMEEFSAERAKYDDYETAIMGERSMPIAEIQTRYDGSERQWNPSEAAIQHLVKHYDEKKRLPPIVLSTEENGEHHIIDGNHRFVAAKRAGLTSINCIVTDLTFVESKWFRWAEGDLKEFDRETDYRYNTSGFNRQFFAWRASRYYRDHFHELVAGRQRRKLMRSVKRLLGVALRFARIRRASRSEGPRS